MRDPRAKLSALLLLGLFVGACGEDELVPPKATPSKGSGGGAGLAGSAGAGSKSGGGAAGASGAVGIAGAAGTGVAGGSGGVAGTAASGSSGASVGGAAGAGLGGVGGAAGASGAAGTSTGGAGGASTGGTAGASAGGGPSAGAGGTASTAGQAGTSGGGGSASGGAAGASGGTGGSSAGGGQAGQGGGGAGGAAGNGTCSPVPEACNGKDDDCDGKTDEATLVLETKGSEHPRGACIGFTSSTDAAGFPLSFALIEGESGFGNDARELYHSLVFGVDGTGAFVDVTVVIRETGKDNSTLLGTARVVLGGGAKPKVVLAKDVTGTASFGVAKGLKLLGTHAANDDATHDFAIPIDNVLDGTSYPAINAIVLRVVGQYAPNMSGGDAATRIVVPGKCVGVERGF